MRVNSCDFNQAHDKSWLVDRPYGSGDNLFIYTRTPIVMFTDDNATRYPMETVVFFRQGSPQQFRPAGQIYADDYMHFYADEEELKFIDSLEIPSGVPFSNLDSSVFLNIQRYICMEYRSSSKNKDESLNHLLRYLLIKLSEAIHDSLSLSISTSTKIAIQEMRTEIFSNLEVSYSIEALASRVGLSVSYFQAVYKQLFGSTCINEIIEARMDKARVLLTTTEYPISQIASMCGYENDSHFSRQFKKHVAVTPSEYRKNQWITKNPNVD